MADRIIATAAVKITADTSRVPQDVEAMMRRIVLGPLPLRLDDAGVIAQLDAITARTREILNLTLGIEDGKARSAIDELTRAANKNVEVVFDSEKARSSIEAITRAVTTPVVAVADTDRARAELADLARPIDVPLRVGGSDDGAEIAAQGEDSGRKYAGGFGIGLKSIAAFATGVGIKSALDATGDFQVNLERIRIQSGATAPQMKQLQKLFIDLGNDVKLGAVSTGDAGAAFATLTKGSFSVEEAINTVRSALQFSIVSQQDAAKATGQLVTIMSQLKIPTDLATLAVDQLAAIDLAAPTATAADFTEAIGYAGVQYAAAFASQTPTERLTGLNTALLILAQNGLTGSRAGETLRRVLTDMRGPTDQAKKGIIELDKAAKANGVTFERGGSIFVDSAGKVRPLIESMGYLKTAFKDLNPQEQIDLLEPVFSTIGKDGVLALQNAVGNWDEYTAATTRAGIAAQLADAEAAGLKGSMNALGGAIETAQIALGQAVSPVLIPFFKDLAASIPYVTAALGELVTTATGLVREVPGVGFILDGLGEAVSKVRKAWNDATFKPLVDTSTLAGIEAASKETDTFRETFGKFVDNLRDASPIFDDVAGAIESVLGFFQDSTAAQAGLVALTAGFIAFKAALGIQALIEGVSAALLLLAANPVVLVVAAIAALAAGLVYAYQHSETFRNMVDSVGRVLAGAFKTAVDAGKVAIDALKDAVKFASDKVSAFIDWIKKIPLGPIDLVVEAAKKLAAPFKAAVDLVAKLFEKLTGLPTEIVVNIVTKLTGFLTEGKDLNAEMSKKVTSKVLAGAFSGFKKRAQGGFFSTATAGIFGEDGPEVILPLSKPKRLLELLKLPQVYPVLAQAVRSLTSTGTGAVLEAVRGNTVGIPTLRGLDPSLIAKTAVTAVTEVYDAVNNGINSNTTNTLEAAGRVADAVNLAVSEIGASVSELGNAVDGFAGSLRDELGGIGDGLGDLRSEIGRIGPEFAEMIAAIREAIKSLVKDVAGTGGAGGEPFIVPPGPAGPFTPPATDNNRVTVPPFIVPPRTGDPGTGINGNDTPGGNGGGQTIGGTNHTSPTLGGDRARELATRTLPYNPPSLGGDRSRELAARASMVVNDNRTITAVTPYVDPAQVGAWLFEQLNTPSFGGYY